MNTNTLQQWRSSGHAIVHALSCERVEKVFGIVGSHVVDIYDALIDTPDITPISPRHEVGAAFMAATYARVSGKTGVCITTAGPGVLNALNGIGQARFSALPVVFIAGGVPMRARTYELHGLTHENYTLEAVRRIVKHAARVNSATEIPAALANAFALARSGRPGPTYVEIPWDLFNQTPDNPMPIYVSQPTAPARFSAYQVESAATAAAKASRVLLVVDKMLADSAGLDDLRKLASERGWFICTTRDGMNLLTGDDDVFAGVLHDHKFGQYAFERVAEADVCIALGFDAGSENLSFVDATARGAIHRLCTYDDAPSSIDGLTLDESLRAFISHVRNHTAVRPGWSHGESPRQGHKRLLEDLQRYSTQTPIHFGYALSRLDRALPEASFIVHDTGSHEVWARSVLPPTTKRSAIGGANWGTMGHAIPAAAGARAANAQARIVCITGDGCLLMSLMDLPTLIAMGGPTLIVNLNDSEYGMITKVQHRAFRRSYATELPTVDYARVAQEFGARAVRVTDPAMLDQVFDEALRTAHPWFVDIVACSDSRYPDFKLAATPLEPA